MTKFQKNPNFQNPKFQRGGVCDGGACDGRPALEGAGEPARRRRKRASARSALPRRPAPFGIWALEFEIFLGFGISGFGIFSGIGISPR
jgi:hypothetical protein